VIRPMCPLAVNQRLPSGPAVIEEGVVPKGRGDSMISGLPAIAPDVTPAMVASSTVVLSQGFLCRFIVEPRPGC
jgi:hypothetical protein